MEREKFLERVIMTIAEMLREGLELDTPYTSIEGTLEYIEDMISLKENYNE